MIATAHPDLDWKRELRWAFEDGKDAEEKLEADTAKAEAAQEAFN
jgi:hypothetical protein